MPRIRKVLSFNNNGIQVVFNVNDNGNKDVVEYEEPEKYVEKDSDVMVSENFEFFEGTLEMKDNQNTVNLELNDSGEAKILQYQTIGNV